jgi:hypothetical protein
MPCKARLNGITSQMNDSATASNLTNIQGIKQEYEKIKKSFISLHALTLEFRCLVFWTE